ncbi:MAG: HAD family phosphatase [Spirochaetaceae bacterium]|jgi:putative hydrolase of the HAD superfamily|nr:HAD family phosphatase [Spirochaetaceae bacterium]
MDAVKAVVFDYGKVICHPPEDGVMEKLAALAGVSRPDFESLVWKLRPPYDRGVVTGPEYYQRILAAAGRPADAALAGTLHRIDTDGWKVLNEETVRLMEDIKAAGFMLGILSNMPYDFLDMARKTYPVFSLPHVGIFSCETGFVKPEPAIYQALTSALDCAPGEIVFFDDMPVNVGGAADAGIRAFLWQDAGTARNLLRGFNVAV